MPGIPEKIQKELDAFHQKQAKAAFEASDADKVPARPCATPMTINTHQSVSDVHSAYI